MILLADPIRHRRGAILIVALWILIVLVGIVLVFGRSMRVEASATANDVAAVQAAAVERGAEQYVMALIDEQKDQVLTLADKYFQAVPVGEGYFWIIRPNYGDDQLPAFGLIDEASKINVNSAITEMLAALPGMTADVPPAIMDWRDSDSRIGAGGAENEYYLAQPRPYYCKNAPLESVEELLLVRGITPQVLYGQRGDGSTHLVSPWNPAVVLPLGADPVLYRGLFDYVTVYSIEPNTTTAGKAHINLNGDRETVRRALRDALGSSRADQIMGRARAPFRDIFDFHFRAGMTSEEFGKVADLFTTSSQRNVMGKVNVNTAPREVLMCLPGLAESDVATLISTRAGIGIDRSSIAWVADAIGRKSIGLGGYITSHSLQFAADIVAVSGNGRAFIRCRIIIDARFTPPRVVYRKDLTDTGWPMQRDILPALRAGAPLPSSAFSQTQSVLP